jgi:hypothetical protein
LDPEDRAMRRFLLAIGLLLVAGPGLADEALVGQWSGVSEGNAIVMTLAADGTMDMSNSGLSLGSGTWTAADGKLTLTLARNGGGSESLACDYLVADDTLRLSGEDPDCAGAPLFTRTG